jgi:Icc-related predicted phosphoesterase
MYLTGGNDDEPSVLEALDEHDGERVIACEGRLIELDDEHTMITVGLSTVTPWDTPREASEAEIATTIDAELAKVRDPSRCVFNFHCPPKDTPIDTCLKLEWKPGSELPQPVREGGRFLTTAGGSQSVRDAIKAQQPLVGLHGHIHESGGRFRIGRTQSFNPGSEYVQGALQGWIVAIQGGRLRGYQHTSG